MGLADTYQWTGPTHKRARCGRFRWWWHWFWRQHCVSRPTLIEWVVGFSLTHNEECIETVSIHKYSIYWNGQYIHVYSSIRYVLEYSSIGYKNTGYICSVLVWKYALYSSIRYVLEYSSIGYIYVRYMYTAWSESMHSKYKVINSALVYWNCI